MIYLNISHAHIFVYNYLPQLVAALARFLLLPFPTRDEIELARGVVGKGIAANQSGSDCVETTRDQWLRERQPKGRVVF